MKKNILFATGGGIVGLLAAVSFALFSFFNQPQTPNPLSFLPFMTRHEVIGFLPYWLLSRANTDYSPYITTLSYFALRIDKDGSIVKLTNPTQEEPGWYMLRSGKADSFLHEAKKKGVTLSLTIDSGDTNAINSFLATPENSAKNLIQNVTPILKKYAFSDLNLDIEYTQPASASARSQFTQFVKEVRRNLPGNITITLEISPIDAVQQRLIDIRSVAPFVTTIVIMTYDYHAPDSFVTGPVAPLSGAGVTSEYDVTTAVEKTLQDMPPQKLILGIPLYGYEWETLGKVPRSAVIPGSGVLASSRRIETLLSSCATCSAQEDKSAREKYISYFDNNTDTTHILFYPDSDATSAKIAFARQKGLGGIALWALGYEGATILNPLKTYKTQ